MDDDEAASDGVDTGGREEEDDIGDAGLGVYDRLRRVQLLLHLVEEDVLVLLLLRRELHGVDLLQLGLW